MVTLIFGDFRMKSLSRCLALHVKGNLPLHLGRTEVYQCLVFRLSREQQMAVP